MRKTSRHQKKLAAARRSIAPPINRAPAEQTLHGIIREDPARAASIGSQLRFATHTLNDIHVPSPGKLADVSVFEGAVLALMIGTGESAQIYGSACMVAPGIALCATHVLSDHEYDLKNSRSELMAIGFGSEGLQLWKVREVTNLDRSDLTLLGLEYASDLPASGTFNQLHLSTRVPQIDERVTIVGVIPTSPPLDVSMGRDLEFEMRVILSQGEVTQHYLGGRDTAVMPWSSIEVNCHAWGSMSGGPVFDKKGRLIGLLSSSLESDDENGPSWVSLLWPVIATEFRGGWPTEIRGTAKTLQEMDPSICVIDGREAVEHIDGPGGRQVRLRILE